VISVIDVFTTGLGYVLHVYKKISQDAVFGRNG